MSKPVSSQTVFSGQIIEVALEQHDLPNGRRSQFEIVHHPGGAAVLPVLEDGRLLLIRQYRVAVGAMIYEIPAGRLEPNESPRQCVARELAEETGYEADAIEALGGCWSTAGFCDEYIHLFLANELRPVPQALEPDEIIELCPLSVEEAMALLDQGAIADSKTQLALLLYQQRLLEAQRLEERGA